MGSKVTDAMRAHNPVVNRELWVDLKSTAVKGKRGRPKKETAEEARAKIAEAERQRKAEYTRQERVREAVLEAVRAEFGPRLVTLEGQFRLSLAAERARIEAIENQLLAERARSEKVNVARSQATYSENIKDPWIGMAIWTIAISYLAYVSFTHL